MRTRWMTWAVAMVATGVTVGVVPQLVTKVVGTAQTAEAAPVSPAGHGKPGQTIEQVRRQFLDHSKDAPVMVVAHRGYWRGAPENSIDAVRMAVDKGAQVVEIDVQRTADGQLVLMHDTSVNRTTNGTGQVADLTLAQVKALRLRVGLGGAQAPLTDAQVPTLAEALNVVKGRAMVNLDKGWAFRDQEYDLLVASGTLDHAIFKSSAPVAEVEQFLARDPRILYSHVVDDGNAASIGTFTGRPPASYELVFDRLTDPQIQPATVATARKTGRIWVNTMWYGLAAGYTDEGSLVDAERGWASVVDRHGADMIQTDNQEQLLAWLSTRDRHGKRDQWPTLPEGAIRVQAEDYSTGGKEVGYHDLEDDNRGGVARKYEGVDICDQAGATVMCWIRGGEWVRYTVEVPRSGSYQVAARVSTPYSPAGRFTLTFDGKQTTAPVDVITTTSHDAFTLQPVPGTRYLSRGTHEFMIRMDPTTYQNFNIDYFQLTPR
ncbi:glycerophosphodiester phosphodiesterase family protein [Micromonospora sp. NPDC050397]|uniref:glycerophosphodiester phosphodiesterase family protein n=1 Tax=Micromonospora sp. NPDC050397 TaxID=3364279 RepID=UPI00384F1485